MTTSLQDAYDEMKSATVTANELLDDPHRDPDSNESILARQFLRLCERVSLIEARTLERVKSLIPGRSWIVLKDTDTEHVEVENVEYNRCRAKVLEALSSLQPEGVSGEGKV